MPASDNNVDDSNYGSDVFTNLDSDIFKLIASQTPIKKAFSLILFTCNITIKREINYIYLTIVTINNKNNY